MLTGRVDSQLQATVEVRITGPAGSATATAVIDTGFTGYLSLPSDIVEAMNLVLAGTAPAVLADGSMKLLRQYEAKVLWLGVEREVAIVEAGGGPLLGMGLLRDHWLILHAKPGGEVHIAATRPL